MSAAKSGRRSAPRAVDPETLVCSPSNQRRRVPHAYVFTARLTVDLTPKLRSRIKAAARERDQSVAQMLRALLRREFPPRAATEPAEARHERANGG